MSGRYSAYFEHPTGLDDGGRFVPTDPRIDPYMSDDIEDLNPTYDMDIAR